MLAGFGMGLALAGVGEPRRLAKQLFALTEGFFAPLFFVWLGASLDLRTVAAHPSLALLGVCLGAAAAAVHGLMALTRQPLSVAIATCAQLGVPVAAATLGRAQGILAPGEDAAERPAPPQRGPPYRGPPYRGRPRHPRPRPRRPDAHPMWTTTPPVNIHPLKDTPLEPF